MQPAIDWLSRVIGKVATWLGGKLNDTVSNISNNVSTISDSYKKEDLRTMMAAKVTGYDANNDAIVAKLGEMAYVIQDVSKNVKDRNNMEAAKMMEQQ